jgi:archaellum component FlaC
MAKIIMTETRASVAENKLALVSDGNSSMEALNKQIAEKDEMIKKLQTHVNDLSIQKEKLKKEINDIRNSVKQITG